jgi:phage tail-like protein
VTDESTTLPSLPGGGAIVRLEGAVVQTVPLGEAKITIGRLPDNRLVLQSTSVSRYHAELRMEAGGTATLTDVGSSGGTFINDEQLKPHQPYSIPGGATFRIGPYTITYVAPTGVTPVLDLPDSPASPGAQKKKRAPVKAPVAEPVALPSEQETIIEYPSRARYPVPLPDGLASRYLRHLPAVYQEDDFLSRFLLIFEARWEPLEWRQNHIDYYFSATTAPAAFLPWLASWLGLALDRHWPEERRRRLLQEAMELYRWRGTSYGLSRMLEVCTGLSPTITEDPKKPYVFRVVVRVPPDARVRPEMIERLVQMHKPAHVGYVLEVST